MGNKSFLGRASHDSLLATTGDSQNHCHNIVHSTLLVQSCLKDCRMQVLYDTFHFFGLLDISIDIYLIDIIRAADLYAMYKASRMNTFKWPCLSVILKFR